MPGFDQTLLWAEELADIASLIHENVPDRRELAKIREFIFHISRLLHSSDVKATSPLVLRMLPYLHRAVSNAEKCVNVHSTYELITSMYHHLPAEASSQIHLVGLIANIRLRLTEMRSTVAWFSDKVINMLDIDIYKRGYLSVCSVFELNRNLNDISHLIEKCQADLTKGRGKVYDLRSTMS